MCGDFNKITDSDYAKLISTISIIQKIQLSNLEKTSKPRKIKSTKTNSCYPKEVNYRKNHK